MLKRHLCIIIIFVLNIFLVDALAYPGSHPQRVKIKLGDWSTSEPFIGNQIFIKTTGSEWKKIKSHHRITCQKGRHSKTQWTLKTPSNKSTGSLSGPRLFIKGRKLKAKGLVLPDEFSLSCADKKIDVIFSLPFNDYVLGVLLSELPSSWPLESLKAQAVAIRSYTRAVIRERQRQSFHLRASVMDQVYKVNIHKEAPQHVYKKFKQAVDETQDLFLVENKRVLKSFYHSDCGGQTTSSYEVWGEKQDSGGVKDIHCPLNPGAQWKIALSKRDVQLKLREHFNLGSLITLDSLRVIRRDLSGRVKTFGVEFDFGISRQLSGQKLRSLIGFQEIRSTLLEIEQRGANYHFKGSGFGHGVGLCQWGSRKLAEQGWRFTKILDHYYSGAKLMGRRAFIPLLSGGGTKKPTLREQHAHNKEANSAKTHKVKY